MGVTIVDKEGDMLLVRGMDKEPGLLASLIRMRVVAILGEVGMLVGSEARRISCQGMAVSAGGEQHYH